MRKTILYWTCAAGALAGASMAQAQDAAAAQSQTGSGTAQPSSAEGLDASGTAPASDTRPGKASNAGSSGADRRDRVEERGEVVVTGNRFQRIMDAPQSKAIIDAEQRNLAGIGNIRTIIDVQPGINFSDTYGLNVRGVGRQTPQSLLGQENTVVQYVDGFINLTPANVAESTLFGGNIQFLRGPAGTTYGRNALAGAVNLVSRAPTKDFTAEVEGGVGRRGYTDVGANIAGPLTDNLGFRIGAQLINTPSIQHNLGEADKKHPGFAVKNRYIEFQLEWRLGGFHIRNRATTFWFDNQPSYPSLTTYRSNLPNGTPAAIFDGLAPNPQYGYAGPVPAKPYQINVNYTGYDKLRNNFQDIVNADLDLGFANLVYVGGYQQYKSSGSSDLDLTSRTSYDANTVAPATFAPGTQVPTDYRANYRNKDHFWSQEARLESKSGEPIGWVVGVYYFNQHFNEYYNNTVANATAALATPTVGTTATPAAPNPNNVTFEQRNIFNVKSEAVFGNVTFGLTSNLHVDAGLRYTWDQKDATNNFRYVYYYPPVFAGDFTPAVNSANPERHDRGLSGRAAIAYEFSPANQIYASYSRGYQSSAFTLGQGLPPNNIAKSEHLDVYELGGFTTMGRLRFDGSIFYQNFFDQQVPVFQQLVTPVTTPTGGTANLISTFTSFVNARRSEIYGAELQATWRPNDHSNIIASYTYLHPTFRSFSGVVDVTEACPAPGPTALGTCAGNALYNTPQDLSGRNIPRTPHNKATLYGYYGVSLGQSGWLYPGGSVAYQSSFYTQPFNVDRFRVPGRAIVGLTLTYRTPDDRLDITGSVLNLFRHRYTDNGRVQIVGTTVSNVTTYGQDRYWTVTARYRF